MTNVIKKIDDNTNPDYFIEEFENSNEIYYSKSNSSGLFSYTTNLTIKYVHDGTDHYKVGNKFYNLKKNQYLILNSGNDVTCFAHNFNDGMSIFMDASILGDVYQANKNIESVFSTNENEVINLLEVPHFCNNSLGNYLIELFAQIKQAANTNGQLPDPLIYYNLAEQMLFSNLRLNDHIKRTSRVKRSVQIEIYEKVMLARDYIESNYNEQISIEQISKIVGLSKYYLIRSFNSVYGKTPYKYIIEKRIENSKKELIHNHNSISDISSNCGFTDISAFSNCFKKHVGLSPDEFRKRHSVKIQLSKIKN